MKERCIKSIEKAKRFLKKIETLNLNQNEIKIVEKARHYIHDAEYFIKKGDFFSSFGASDYAYGLLEALLILKKL